MAADLRELTFQNVIDQVLKPAGVKVGGFPDDMFLELTEEEKESWTCNICFLVLNDPRECANRHLFCHTCIFAWSLTFGENSKKCPVCRNEQRTYNDNKAVSKQLSEQRVKCVHDGCTYRSPLKFYLMHSHGRERFSNAHVDLESLRPQRITLPLPSLGIIGNPNGMQRVLTLRDQLHEGRMMIHQMVLLLHLEMQLRQQAMVSYSRATQPSARLQRLDEVLALNEQLNEIGTILAVLLHEPTNRQSTSRQDASSNARSTTGSSAAARAGTLGSNVPASQPSTAIAATANANVDEESDSSDSESSGSTVIPSTRAPIRNQSLDLASRNISTSRPHDSERRDRVLNEINSSTGNATRPLRRSEIRQHILQRSQDDSNTLRSSVTPSSNAMPNSVARALGRSMDITTSQVNQRQNNAGNSTSGTVPHSERSSIHIATEPTREERTNVTLPRISNSESNNVDEASPVPDQASSRTSEIHERVLRSLREEGSAIGTPRRDTGPNASMSNAVARSLASVTPPSRPPTAQDSGRTQTPGTGASNRSTTSSNGVSNMDLSPVAVDGTSSSMQVWDTGIFQIGTGDSSNEQHGATSTQAVVDNPARTGPGRYAPQRRFRRNTGASRPASSQASRLERLAQPRTHMPPDGSNYQGSSASQGPAARNARAPPRRRDSVSSNTSTSTSSQGISRPRRRSEIRQQLRKPTQDP